MTPEEKAFELSRKYAAPKNKNREKAVYESSLEMTGWIIDKVCKWLCENLETENYINSSNGEIIFKITESKEILNLEQFIEKFKKEIEL